MSQVGLLMYAMKEMRVWAAGIEEYIIGRVGCMTYIQEYGKYDGVAAFKTETKSI